MGEVDDPYEDQALGFPQKLFRELPESIYEACVDVEVLRLLNSVSPFDNDDREAAGTDAEAQYKLQPCERETRSQGCISRLRVAVGRNGVERRRDRTKRQNLTERR